MTVTSSGKRTSREAPAPLSDRVPSVALSTVLEWGRDLDVNVTFAPKPDTEVHCDVSLRALINEVDEVVGAIVCVADVTEDLRMREELKQRARYDLLTGCLNQRSDRSRATFAGNVDDE